MTEKKREVNGKAVTRCDIQDRVKKTEHARPKQLREKQKLSKGELARGKD